MISMSDTHIMGGTIFIEWEIRHFDITGEQYIAWVAYGHMFSLQFVWVDDNI